MAEKKREAIQCYFESAKLKKNEDGRVAHIHLEIGLDLGVCKQLPSLVRTNFMYMRDPVNATDQIKLSTRWGSLVCDFRSTPETRPQLHVSEITAQDLMLKRVKTSIVMKMTLLAPLVKGTADWVLANFGNTVFLDLDIAQMELLPLEDEKEEKPVKDKPSTAVN